MAVEAATYEKIKQSYPGAPLNAYAFCLQAMFGEIINFSGYLRSKDDSIRLVVESGEKGGHPIISELENELGIVQIKQYYKLSSVTLASKSKFRQLELADLVAYETFKYYKTANGTRFPFRFLHEHYVKEFNKQSIKLMQIATYEEEGIREWLSRFQDFYG
jgi:hypothetical protein